MPPCARCLRRQRLLLLVEAGLLGAGGGDGGVREARRVGELVPDERGLALLRRRALTVVLHLGRPAVDRRLHLLEREPVARRPLAQVAVEANRRRGARRAAICSRARAIIPVTSASMAGGERNRFEPIGSSCSSTSPLSRSLGTRAAPPEGDAPEGAINDGCQSRYPSFSASIVNASPGVSSAARISQKRPSSSVDGASLAPRDMHDGVGERARLAGPVGRHHHDPLEIARVGRARRAPTAPPPPPPRRRSRRARPDDASQSIRFRPTLPPRRNSGARGWLSSRNPRRVT